MLGSRDRIVTCAVVFAAASGAFCQCSTSGTASGSNQIGGVRLAWPQPYRTHSILTARRQAAAARSHCDQPSVVRPTYAYPGSRVCHTTTVGSGFSLSGAYKDDNLQLGVRLGSPLVQSRTVCTTSAYPRAGYAYGASYVSSSVGFDGTYVPSSISTPASAPDSIQDAEETQAVDVVLRLLIENKADEAVDSARDALADDPDDAHVMRLLAVALIADGRPRDGVAVMSMAYRTDQTLARQRLLPEMFHDDRTGLRKLLRRTVTYANQNKGSSAWLSVAVLMQAEDRKDVARRMLERAKEAGLDDAVYHSLNREL